MGEAVAFFGTGCRHHVTNPYPNPNPNKNPTRTRPLPNQVPANPSDCTRVSLDFRVGVEGHFDPQWSMRGTKADHCRMQVTL